MSFLTPMIALARRESACRRLSSASFLASVRPRREGTPSPRTKDHTVSPAAACLATVAPQPSSSSSGCAATTRILRLAPGMALRAGLIEDFAQGRDDFVLLGL